MYGMRIKECTKIADHLNIFNTLISQLSSKDVKIDDEDKTINSLCTLPKSWGQVFSSINFSTTIPYNLIMCLEHYFLRN